MDLHFEASGNGEPLVILHGLFGSLDNWQGISPKLAKQFKVVAVDQRNHGRSPHSVDMDYRLMAEDVVRLMQKLALENAFVLGHSMGGKTAMQLALFHPSVVRKLVVVDIAPHSYPPRHLKVIIGMRSLDLSHFQTRKEMEAALAPAVPEVATRQFLLKNVARNQSGGFYWRLGLEEIQQNYARLTEAITSAESFKKPTLFIRGEKSDYLMETDLAAIKALFPLASLQTIPGAGHLVHVENPDAFVQSVVSFFSND